jgi:hypothetical protein
VKSDECCERIVVDSATFDGAEQLDARAEQAEVLIVNEVVERAGDATYQSVDG